MQKTAPHRWVNRPLRLEDEPTADRKLLELTIIWEDVVLEVIHLGTNQKWSLPGSHDASLTLVEVDELHATFLIPDDARLEWRNAVGDGTDILRFETVEGPMSGRRLRLAFGEDVAWTTGELTFAARFVRGATPGPLRGATDWEHRKLLVVSALLHGFLAAAAMLAPREAVLEIFARRPFRPTEILPEPSKPAVDWSRPSVKLARMPSPEDGEGGEGARPKVKPKASWRSDELEGLLGLLRRADGGSQGVLGDGRLGAGLDRAMAGLSGPGLADSSPGFDGLATGAGESGGAGPISLGALRARGSVGSPKLGRKRTHVVPGRTQLCGKDGGQADCGLGRDEVARTMLRNLARFKHCYERELNAQPNLQGRVNLSFLILPSGAVAKERIEASTLNHASAEDCIRGVAASLRFPEPRGGQPVEVRYPFVFRRI